MDLTEEEKDNFMKEFNELLEKNSYVASMSPQYINIKGTNEFKTAVSLVILKKVKDETIKED